MIDWNYPVTAARTEPGGATCTIGCAAYCTCYSLHSFLSFFNKVNSLLHLNSRLTKHKALFNFLCSVCTVDLLNGALQPKFGMRLLARCAHNNRYPALNSSTCHQLLVSKMHLVKHHVGDDMEKGFVLIDVFTYHKFSHSVHKLESVLHACNKCSQGCDYTCHTPEKYHSKRRTGFRFFCQLKKKIYIYTIQICKIFC